MLKKLDQSTFLSKIVARTTNYLAKHRGLPIVLGIILLVIGLPFQLADVYSSSKLIEFVGTLAHNAGVLIAFIGIVLMIPLGK